MLVRFLMGLMLTSAVYAQDGTSAQLASELKERLSGMTFAADRLRFYNISHFVEEEGEYSFEMVETNEPADRNYVIRAKISPSLGEAYMSAGRFGGSEFSVKRLEGGGFVLNEVDEESAFPVASLKCEPGRRCMIRSRVDEMISPLILSERHTAIGANPYFVTQEFGPLLKARNFAMLMGIYYDLLNPNVEESNLTLHYVHDEGRNIRWYASHEITSSISTAEITRVIRERVNELSEHELESVRHYAGMALQGMPR